MAFDAIKSEKFSSLPTELVVNIFSFLTAKELVRSRRVCQRWKDIIDGLVNCEYFWEMHCRKNFPETYREAHEKSPCNLSWFGVFKSLSLWPQFLSAREERDVLAVCVNDMDENINLQVLPNGIIGVHKKNGVNYYDINTLEGYPHRKVIHSCSLGYAENNKFLVILGVLLHLYVIRKNVVGTEYETNVMYQDVKTFLLTNGNIFYVTTNDEIYRVDLYFTEIQTKLLYRLNEPVMCLAPIIGGVSIATYDRNVYTLVNKTLKLQGSINDAKYPLQLLKVNKLWDHVQWQVYKNWMYLINRPIPNGPSQCILTVKKYGPMVFVGCRYNILRVYYNPTEAEEFDFHNEEPMKQYNLIEHKDLPADSASGVNAIDVLEREEGHTVVACLTKAIAIINFTHNFKRSSSLAMLPYNETDRVKLFKPSNAM